MYKEVTIVFEAPIDNRYRRIFIELYAPEDIDDDRLRDVVMKIVTSLYKDNVGVIKVSQPVLMERVET